MHVPTPGTEAADTVCFLKDGIGLEQGTPEVNVSAPLREETRTFLARVLG